MAIRTRKVIIGVSDQASGDDCQFAERLVRGLTHHAWDARILLLDSQLSQKTSDTSYLDTSYLNTSYLKSDVPYERLPFAPSDPWGRRWQMLERYLEEKAPCIFIINNEFLYAAIVERLSNRVHLVAVMHSEDAVGCEQIVKFAESLNAVVTPSDRIHWNVMNRLPHHLTARMLPISEPERGTGNMSEAGKSELPVSSVPTQEEADLAEAYIKLFSMIALMAEKKQFLRKRRWMHLPIIQTKEIDLFDGKEPQREIDWVNQRPFWPDANLSKPHRSGGHKRDAVPSTSGTKPADIRLEDHRLIVAMPGGRISGADIALSRLIRQLRQEGMDARVVGTKSYWDRTALDLEEDIPVDPYPMRWDAPWPMQWAAMIDYLEGLAPCIFLSNSDATHAAMVPRLSNRVKVVSLVHKDEPEQYVEALRLGRYSNAIVGTSAAIVQHLAGLDPSLEQRLISIPNGTEVAPISVRPYTRGTPLRLIYVGRLDNYQKRCDDLLKIACALDALHLPFVLTLVGDGPDGEAVRADASELTEQGKIRFLGKLPNAEVQKLMQEQDVFLLPSAFGGCSVSLLEAMANGLVPLVSDVRSGIPELLQHEINGFVVPVGDIDGYVLHLTALYESPDLRQRVGTCARQTIIERGYRTEDMVARYRALFEDIVLQAATGNFARVRGRIAPPEYLKPETAWRGQLNVARFRFKSKFKSKEKQ